MGDGDGLVLLVDAVRALRSQLTIAVAESKAEKLRFDLSSVEFEFNAVLSREGSGAGGLSFKLFGLGAEGSASAKVTAQHTQKIKLVLAPFSVDETDREAPLGGRRREISISSKKKKLAAGGTRRTSS